MASINYRVVVLSKINTLGKHVLNNWIKLFNQSRDRGLFNLFADTGKNAKLLQFIGLCFCKWWILSLVLFDPLFEKWLLFPLRYLYLRFNVFLEFNYCLNHYMYKVNYWTSVNLMEIFLMSFKVLLNLGKKT